MNKYDIVIAGAGIAGCIIARNATKLGYSVALIDRRLSAHLGHDWWDSVDSHVFEEVDIPFPEPPELMLPSSDTKIYSPLETVYISIRDTPNKNNIDRKLFAQRLLKYAEEAGAQFFEKTAVIGPIIENDFITGLYAKNAKNEKIEFYAKITIDATGMAAALRKKIPERYGFQNFIHRSEMFITHREIYQNLSNDKTNIVVFGRDNGVVWVNRSQTGLVDFFAGVINFDGKPSPRQTVRELIRKHIDNNSQLVRGNYGAPIPVRRGFDSFVAPGFLLCGDVACQCNPLDGSGIASSLRAGHIASQTINASLKNERYDIAALWSYNAAYKHSQDAEFAQLHALQKFMLSEPKSNLEFLFRRKFIKPQDFWGSDSAQISKSKISPALQLLKIIYRPSLALRIIRLASTVETIKKHYREFPSIYNQDEFHNWSRKNAELFESIPCLYYS